MDVQRRGSVVSDKHIEQSVLNGRLVEAMTATQTYRGYICGLDDYHYTLIPQEYPKQILVLSKSSTSLRIFSDRTLTDETKEFQEQLDPLIEPFRTKLREGRLTPKRPRARS